MPARASFRNTQTRIAADLFDQIISDARKPYILHALLVMNRRRSGVGFLFDDEDGHAEFIAWAALGLRKAKWDSVVPWYRFMSKPEREAFEPRIAQFKPTLRNIAAAARLTRADRAKYGNEERLVGNKIKRPMQALLQLPIIDGDLDAERRVARNAAQGKRRKKANAVAVAGCANPRAVAVIEAGLRIARRRGCQPPDALSVPNIIRSIERSGDRALFPRSQSSFRRTVYRLIDRLVKRGIMQRDLRLNIYPGNRAGVYDSWYATAGDRDATA